MGRAVVRPDPSDVSHQIVDWEPAALPVVAFCIGVEEISALRVLSYSWIVADSTCEFVAWVQVRVKLCGSTWVDDWYSGARLPRVRERI